MVQSKCSDNLYNVEASSQNKCFTLIYSKTYEIDEICIQKVRDFKQYHKENNSFIGTMTIATLNFDNDKTIVNGCNNSIYTSNYNRLKNTIIS